MEDKKTATQQRPIGGFRGPMGGPVRGGTPPKAKNFKKTMARIAGYLKPYWVYLAFVAIAAIVSTIFAIASPKILGNMTDEIIKGIIPHVGARGALTYAGINFGAIASIGFWLIGLYVISAAFSYLQSWLTTTVSQKVTYAFRKEVSEKIARLPLRYFDRHENGDIVSYVTNDIETISQNLNQSMTQLITSVITIIGILAMMLSISWQMTIVAILVLPLSLVFISFIIKKSQRFFDKQQAALGEIDGHIDEITQLGEIDDLLFPKLHFLR
jgi:ATP-binding cassette subfamily B protein